MNLTLTLQVMIMVIWMTPMRIMTKSAGKLKKTKVTVTVTTALVKMSTCQCLHWNESTEEVKLQDFMVTNGPIYNLPPGNEPSDYFDIIFLQSRKFPKPC